jgi:hypothetical protein
VLQIAAIFEFGGAMLLGRVVTSTIAGMHGSTCQHSSLCIMTSFDKDNTVTTARQISCTNSCWACHSWGTSACSPHDPITHCSSGLQAGCRFNSHQNARSLNSYISSNILKLEYRDDNLRCVWAPVGGIADPSVFGRQPEIYAYGMVRECTARHAMVVTT